MRVKFHLIFFTILIVGTLNIFSQNESAGEPNQSVPKTISGGVLNGKAVNLPKPVYPAAAKAVRAQGAVNVQVIINEEGNVISANAVSGHPLLRATSVKAAREAKFSTTLLNGQAVKVTGVIVYNFVLPSEEKTSGNSKVFLPMTLAMFMNALKVIPPNEEALNILRQISNILPANFKVEKSQFSNLINANAAERGKFIDEIITTMRNNATPTEVWAIDVGKNWGLAMGQAFQIVQKDFGVETKTFAGSLQSLNWLLESPPNDISQETLKKIQKLSAYNGEVDTISPEFVSAFIKSSIEFLDYIIKENKQNSSN